MNCFHPFSLFFHNFFLVSSRVVEEFTHPTYAAYPASKVEEAGRKNHALPACFVKQKQKYASHILVVSKSRPCDIRVRDKVDRPRLKEKRREREREKERERERYRQKEID